ncbi:hypothetical protein AKJ16_DCAP04411 [Drosera capensis]
MGRIYWFVGINTHPYDQGKQSSILLVYSIFRVAKSRVDCFRCQPWTITLTGVLVLAFSWILMHSVVLTSIALSLICAWWYIFLYSYPKAYSEMIAERRRKVSDGVEDTYGLRRQ